VLVVLGLVLMRLVQRKRLLVPVVVLVVTRNGFILILLGLMLR
jgi:hypothetical protein